MWGLILTVGAVIVVALFPAVRCAVTHPLHVLWYGVLDSFTYLRHARPAQGPPGQALPAVGRPS